jgi:hypothetical protein
MRNLQLKAPFDASLDRFIPACLVGWSVVHFLYEYPNEQTSLCGRTGGWYWITPAPELSYTVCAKCVKDAETAGSKPAGRIP